MDLRSVLGSSLPSGSMMVLPNENPLFKNGKEALLSPFGNSGLSVMPDSRLVDRRDGSGGISILISANSFVGFQDVDPRSFRLKLEDSLVLPSTMVNSWQADDDVMSVLELELERRVKSSGRAG